MKKCIVLFAALFLVITIAAEYLPASPAIPKIIPEIPVKGMVTMIDLGAKQCAPCRMMAPILEELEKEYQGRAAIVFIDVWEDENIKYAQRFKVRGIPTQIFFDENGREVDRHTGFLAKKKIISAFEELGVK